MTHSAEDPLTMALSPWKRLTRLMLRRRPADQVQAQLSDDRNVSDDVVDTPDVAFANLEVGDPAGAALVPTGAVADELLQLPEAEPAEAVETAAELAPLTIGKCVAFQRRSEVQWAFV